MFDQIDFERRFYTLITEEVNYAFSELLEKDSAYVQQEGLKMLRQIMEALHSIAEESVMQGFYGLLANKKRN